MPPNWQDEARGELAAIKSTETGWSYRRNGAACVEPTVLASLALRVSGNAESREGDLRHGRIAARWLASIQRPDGRLPVSQVLESPGWTTPFALVLWSTLAAHDAEQARAARWLLTVAGSAEDRNANVEPGDAPKGFKPGWAWVTGTHSWVEPTAMAILALSRAGFGDDERVAAGTRMILDRSLPHGGWNCGNNVVFGHELRPQPVPTALSLLALAAQGESSQAVERGVDYLRRAITTVRAPVSLGWSMLALRAYEAVPSEADSVLSEAFGECAGRSDGDSVRGLALLLLASARTSSSLLLARQLDGARTS